jgi:hypothetical protein
MRIVLRLLGALPFVANDPLKNFRENLANSRFIANAQFPMQVGIRCSPLGTQNAVLSSEGWHGTSIQRPR